VRTKHSKTKPNARQVRARLVELEMALAPEASHAPFDFEDEAGHLQHNNAACPLCAVNAVRKKYRALVRKDVLAARERREKEQPGVDDNLAKIEMLAAEMLGAQIRYAKLLETPGVSVADLCDAAASEELAESNYELTVAKNREYYGRYS